MYQNRIRRTNNKLDLHSLIRRSEIAFDQQARYVEFVCDVWNEGRFGHDLADPVVIDWLDRPDLEPRSFLDLHDSVQHRLNWPNYPPPTRVRSTLGRTGIQADKAAYRRKLQIERLNSIPAVHNSPAALSPNQGRGSP